MLDCSPFPLISEYIYQEVVKLELYPNKSGIGFMEPIALINYNVCLITGNTRQYRKVTWYEPIAPFQFLNIGAVAAGVTSPRTEAVNLEFFDGEFGQLRWYPIDNAQVNLFIPQSNGRGILERGQVPVDMQIIVRDPDLHLTEMYIWEDKTPWFEAINGGDYALSGVRLIGMGYRYVSSKIKDPVVREIEAGRVECVFLPCYGQAGQVE